MKVIQKLKQWITVRKLLLAQKWCEQVGLTPVRIVQRAGTDYIIDAKNRWRKIGR